MLILDSTVWVQVFLSPLDFKLSLLGRMSKLIGANRKVMNYTSPVFSMAKVSFVLSGLSALAR